jgi:hypothetical protein
MECASGKRVFICLVLILIFIAVSGCHTVKYQWFPPDPTIPMRPEARELGGIEVDLIKVSF